MRFITLPLALVVVLSGPVTAQGGLDDAIGSPPHRPLTSAEEDRVQAAIDLIKCVEDATGSDYGSDDLQDPYDFADIRALTPPADEDRAGVSQGKHHDGQVGVSEDVLDSGTIHTAKVLRHEENHLQNSYGGDTDGDGDNKGDADDLPFDHSSIDEVNHGEIHKTDADFLCELSCLDDCMVPLGCCATVGCDDIKEGYSTARAKRRKGGIPLPQSMTNPTLLPDYGSPFDGTPPYGDISTECCCTPGTSVL